MAPLPNDRLLDRKSFSAETFRRDGHRCVICGAPAVDAHHILDRKLFVDGGYYLSNASSLCSPCHLRAERTEISVEDIRTACGISRPALPDGFPADKQFDKWGNEILPDGTRLPGPLIRDDGCRKILAEAGILYSGIVRLYG